MSTGTTTDPVVASYLEKRMNDAWSQLETAVQRADTALRNDDGSVAAVPPEYQQLFVTALAVPPAWAMDWDTHQTTIQRTATYRCLHCDHEHEEYRQNARELPYAKVCGSLVESTDG